MENSTTPAADTSDTEPSNTLIPFLLKIYDKLEKLEEKITLITEKQTALEKYLLKDNNKEKATVAPSVATKAPQLRTNRTVPEAITGKSSNFSQQQTTALQQLQQSGLLTPTLGTTKPSAGTRRKVRF